MSELKPCPFCGEQPKVEHYEAFDNDEWYIGCNCECEPCTKIHFTYKQAVAAWNTRAAMSYEDLKILIDELGISELTGDYKQAAEYWQRMYEEAFAERTCKVAASYSPSDMNEQAEWYFAFTCGCELYWDESEPPNYCPNCGAKVVGE